MGIFFCIWIVIKNKYYEDSVFYSYVFTYVYSGHRARFFGVSIKGRGVASHVAEYR